MSEKKINFQQNVYGGVAYGYIEQLTVNGEEKKHPIEILREHAASESEEVQNDVITLEDELKKPEPDKSKLEKITSKLNNVFKTVKICVEAIGAIVKVISAL